MPPVECTSLASGAEAPHYLALSPLVEDYYPFMDFQQPFLLSRQEVLLSSAALPDTPNPLSLNMNFDSADSYTGFNFDHHYQTSNENFHQNNFESETSSIFKSSCDVLEGKDSNMAMQSTANCKEIPIGSLQIDGPEFDNKKIDSLNSWSRKDIVDWFVNYGASKESVENLPFTNLSSLYSMLMDDMEPMAKMLGMATISLQKACESLCTNNYPSQSAGYAMPAGHMFPNGNHEMLHEVKQESNSQLEYPWPEQANYAYKEEDYTSEEDQEEYVPEKPQVQVPRRTGKRGRPPSMLSKAAKRKEKGHGKLWEFIRDLLKEPKYCPSLICWENHDEGVFRFVSSEKVAKLWGDKRKNSNMTYEKLSRAMRYYYKSQILLPVTHRRLVYKFGPNAVNWRCENPNFASMP